MRIAILDLTTHPEPLLTGLPTMGQLIEAWLSPAMPDAELSIHDIATSGAPIPALDDFDGVVLSGSEKGVYDDTPWMEPLRAFLHTVRKAEKPVYGICFGHQIMADTWGGKAEQVAEIAIGARPFTMEGEMVDAHVWHKDQVTAVPPDARVTGQASHCPVGALTYDFPARSVQFHPELTEGELRNLFERGRDILLAGEDADAATASFGTASVAVDLQAREAAEFFRGTLRKHDDDQPSGIMSTACDVMGRPKVRSTPRTGRASA